MSGSDLSRTALQRHELVEPEARQFILDISADLVVVAACDYGYDMAKHWLFCHFLACLAASERCAWLVCFQGLSSLSAAARAALCPADHSFVLHGYISAYWH